MQSGQLVICINSKPFNAKNRLPPPLKEGAKYLINEIKKCSCGKVTFDVGISNPSSESWWCQCGVKRNDGIWWCDSRRFAQITVDQEHQKAIEKLKEEFVHHN